MIFTIVDAVSTGKALASRLVALGHECIHVRSLPEFPPCYQGGFDASLFVRDLGCDADGLVTDFVVPGAETGVELADELSERLGCLSNGTELSAARRDKFKMLEALKERGLRAAEHFKSADIDDILGWVKAHGKFPVVLKPVKSAGADSVTLCGSEGEVRGAFEKIIGVVNQLGVRNDEVIVQSFLDGTEYIVNSVSRGGQHYVCDIWKCRKERVAGAGLISCVEELVAFEGELAEYACRALDALGIKHGPAHMEIMVTAEGPVLIEAGARLQGAIHPASITQATGHNQVDLMIEAYTQPQKFLERVGKRFEVKKRMFHLFMLSPVDGVLKGLPRLDEVKGLSSFFHYNARLKIGEPIRRTVDLFSSVGMIDLIHPDGDVVERDYRKLRELERGGLYLV